MRFVNENTGFWIPPLLFLVVLTFAFGLLLPSLGFYWDDWPPILIEKMQDSQRFWEFYQYDRPFSAWTYVALFPILGIQPIGWQIFTFGLRWLTTVFIWLSLREIWPGRRKQAVWAALIFALYPSFDQQAISVAFSQHWICYLIYAVSIWAMIKAVRTKIILYSGLALILAALHLWTMEYFAGLELLRPFILLILAGETGEQSRHKINFVVKRWWPYLLIFVAYVYWRMFLLEFPGEDPNPIVIFAQLQENPITALWQLFEVSFQETVYTLFGVWNKTIDGRALELDSRFFRSVIGVSILSALIVWFSLSALRDEQEDDDPGSTLRWGYKAIALGSIAVLLGAMPAWMAGRESAASFFSSRFSLASMFGASLFCIGLLEWVTPRVFVKLTLVSVLTLVTTNYHLRTQGLYRDSWDLQQKFYWQLYWRAPYIEPGTPLLSDNEVLLFAGGYATAMGINLTYHEGARPGDMAYWFFVLDDRLEGQMFRLRSRSALEGVLRNLTFSGESTQSLVINHNGQSCLHVLEQGRAESALLPTELQEILPVSNFSRIHFETDNPPPDPDIFGPEPDHSWCYYYQKAELSRQAQDWEKIASLGDQALTSGYSPYDPMEWFVFIEGYGISGNVDMALAITREVFENRPDYRTALCELWNELASQQPGNARLQSEWEALLESPICQPE